MIPLFLVASLSVFSPAWAAEPRPNLLFIFCGDLTTQAISSFGDSRKLLDTEFR